MNKSLVALILFLLGILVIAQFLPLYYTVILGIILVIVTDIKLGWKKGLIPVIGISLIIFILYFGWGYPTNIYVLVFSPLTLFLINLLVGRAINYFRDKNKQLNETKRKLEEKNKLLQSILNNAPIGIWLVDKEQNPIIINKTFREQTGFGTEDISMTDEEIKMCKNTDDRALESDKPQRFEEKITFKDGEKHILQTIKTGFYYEEEETMAVLGLGLDITQRKRREERIRKLSFYDQLTKLYNRRYFENEIERLNLSRELPISIIVGDLNRLKQVNDNYGHQRGDRYIKKAAEIIGEVTRDEDVVARIGGDEFAIILPRTPEESAEKLCKRLQGKFRQFNSNQTDKKDLPVILSISLGCATATSKKQDLNEIFKQADSNMYENKGRNAANNYKLRQNPGCTWYRYNST